MAVFIFSVISTLSWQIYEQTANMSLRLDTEMARLLELQRAMQTLSNDLAQYHPRPVREPIGDGWRAPLIADARNTFLLELTRSGYANPLQAPRATSQRVAYRIEDGELIRAQWPVLDPVVATEPDEVVVLDQLEQFLVRYLPAGATDWVSEWPPTGAANQPPRAVEISLVHEYWGEMRRVIEVRR